MLDDFFVRALLAGLGLAALAGPLGCLIVWRRMAYFGDTMAHAALLGVALGFLLEINLTLGVFLAATGVALSLLILQRQDALSTDALLGILSHSTLALGLVLLALMHWVRIDLMAYLFGDILSVSKTDLAIVAGVMVLVLALLAWFWRPLLAATVDEDLARAEGMAPKRARILLMLVLALTIAIAMKIVGVLLITSLLIIPAATARRFAASPEQMAVMASIAGMLGVAGGLFGSLRFDTPSGPSIVVAALLLFLASRIPGLKFRRAPSGREGDVS